MPMDEPDGKLLDFCLTHLADPKESDGSRSAMIKLAARMCKPYPDLCKELTLCLDMMPQDSSPSIAAAKRNAFGYDAARFIPKHSSRKKERFKNDSKINISNPTIRIEFSSLANKR